MFIVVYDGLACLSSFFIIFILTVVFPTYFLLLIPFCSVLFLQRIFEFEFYIYQNTLQFPNSKTFF